MPTATELEATFLALKAILQPFAARLVIVHDSEDEFYLDTAHVMKNRKPLFFAAARTGKQYVSYHLMPVYLWPDMLKDASAALMARMQGKSCFNFRSPDPAHLEELRVLTSAGFDRYRESGYVR